MKLIPEVYQNIFIANFLLFNAFYLLAIYRRDYSVIDIAWGAGFFNAMLVFVTTAPELGPSRLMLASLVLLWSGRLSIFLAYRKFHHPEEDWRYQEIRKRQGKNSSFIAYFTIFLLQLCLQFVLLIPIIETLRSPTQATLWLCILAGTVTLFGILYETVADWQKFLAKQKAPSKPVVTGLWRFSRHANYFGEIVTWIGFSLFAFGTEAILIALLGPALMIFLLLKVSGIPLIQKSNNLKPEYKDYYNNTNLLLPWPARKVRKS